jgi:hypothetical protein
VYHWPLGNAPVCGHPDIPVLCLWMNAAFPLLYLGLLSFLCLLRDYGSQ